MSRFCVNRSYRTARLEYHNAHNPQNTTSYHSIRSQSTEFNGLDAPQFSTTMRMMLVFRHATFSKRAVGVKAVVLLEGRKLLVVYW